MGFANLVPGISGSYLLLIFGLYETVVGSLSSQELLGNTGEALGILIPVGLGAALGIALLSNVLKALLARASRPCHGVLLGLMLGSVIGLYPFQQPVHPWLAQQPVRKAVGQVLQAQATEPDDSALAIQEAKEHWGLAEQVPLKRLVEECQGLTIGSLKTRAETLERFSPGARQVLLGLLLFVLGFGITRLASRGPQGSSAD